MEEEKEQLHSDHDSPMELESDDAAAAAPLRSRSELNSLEDEWLLAYASSHGIGAGYKWSREDRNTIEAAALSATVILGTGADMVKRIAELLAD